VLVPTKKDICFTRLNRFYNTIFQHYLQRNTCPCVVQVMGTNGEISHAGWLYKHKERWMQ